MSNTETLPVETEEKFETVAEFTPETAPTPKPKAKRKPRKVKTVEGSEQQLWNEIEERLAHIFQARVRESMEDVLKFIQSGEPAAAAKFDPQGISMEVAKQAARIVHRSLGMKNGNGQASE